MKRFLTYCFLFLLTAFSAVAQESKQECPKIEVIGPAGIGIPGEEMIFTAVVSGVGLDVKYDWKIENGAATIVNGQGTASIRAFTGEGGMNVTATVRILNAPAGCKDSASEVIGVAQKPEIHSLDEWGEMTSNEIRGRLDMFFAEVVNNPNYYGVVVFYGEKEKRRNVMSSRLKLFVSHAKFRKFDLGQLVFVFDDYDTKIKMTKVFRFRQGFSFPCSGCVFVDGRKLSR